MMWRFLLLVLAGAVLMLIPMAHASPPDQTWIAGLYDNADYDDVVCAVTAEVASLELRPLADLRSVDTVVAVVVHIDERPHPTLALSSNHTRPPPSS